MPLVYLIMLNYNGKHHLEYSLPSVMCTAYNNYRLIIVDNASSDGSLEYIKSNFPRAELIVNQKNRGWAGGNNDGIKYAIGKGAKYIVLINNDILVHPDWIKNAVGVAEQNPNIGAIGFEGLSLHREKDKLEESIKMPSVLSFEDTDFITGWAIFIRAEAFKYLGLIDEKYFSFGEETDFEIRLKIAGYRMVRINTPLCHYSGGSYSKYPIKAAYLMMRNCLRLELKYKKFKRFFNQIFFIINKIRLGREELSVEQGYFYSNILVPKTKMLSFIILSYSILWNLIHLPTTIITGRKEYKRAIKVRCVLQERCNNYLAKNAK